MWSLSQGHHFKTQESLLDMHFSSELVGKMDFCSSLWTFSVLTALTSVWPSLGSALECQMPLHMHTHTYECTCVTVQDHLNIYQHSSSF